MFFRGIRFEPPRAGMTAMQLSFVVGTATAPKTRYRLEAPRVFVAELAAPENLLFGPSVILGAHAVFMRCTG
ncbi:MAG TPA: hypothetical protein VME40_14240 [Caulobacteraceae bacterium]|nr:hypothetical protein [Caulobacteraceae bacterium]